MNAASGKPWNFKVTHSVRTGAVRIDGNEESHKKTYKKLEQRIFHANALNSKQKTR